MNSSVFMANRVPGPDPQRAGVGDEASCEGTPGSASSYLHITRKLTGTFGPMIVAHPSRHGKIENHLTIEL